MSAMPLTLRTRLTLWNAAILVVVLGLFAADLLMQQRRLGLQRVDGELAATETQLVNMLSEELRELDTPALAARESCMVIAAPGRAVAVLDGQGALLGGQFDPIRQADLLANTTSAPHNVTIDVAGAMWRMHVAPRTIEDTPLTLVVARPLTDVLRDQEEIRHAVLLGIPLVLLLSGVGGFALASFALKPVTAMASRAARIPLDGTDDLGTPARMDEIGQLTVAFNALVGRLRAALRTQRQFMTDASHELRNPVSIIRTASDVTLSRAHRQEHEYREALSITSDESRRLGALVDDMLMLARADGGGYPLRPIDVDLDEVLRQSVHAVAPLAAARDVAVSCDPDVDVTLHADIELLRRLLHNLLLNAVQHTPHGGRVSVSVRTGQAFVSIDVSDTGVGIAPEDRERIFERFVQLDASRRSEGAGLGLTIARWIAGAHGGTISVAQSGPDGSTFRLTVPALQDYGRRRAGGFAAFTRG